MKSTFCLTNGATAHVSQYLGDMEHLKALEVLDRSVQHYLDLFRIAPEAIACDKHPNYYTSIWAKQFAREHGLPLLEVQHHHAHITSLCAEQQWEQPVIGVCFDGTGYGTDRAIWGGEFLCCSEGEFTRAAHLKYVPLSGGDASIKRPYRVALAHLNEAGIDWCESCASVQACPAEELTILHRQLEQNINCVPTSSMGRLFDAVASLLGISQQVTYEGQAAIEMEAVCRREDLGSYSFDLIAGEPLLIDPQNVLRAVLDDLAQGVAKPAVASRFHRAVAQMVADVCRSIRATTQLTTVTLSGGVFQNLWLLHATVELLEAQGFQVLVHRTVPANDGGISLGQAVIAQQVLTNSQATVTSV